LGDFFNLGSFFITKVAKILWPLFYGNIYVVILTKMGWAAIRAIFIGNTWGRCYDHNFLRFLAIFCEKIGVLLKNQCYDQNFV
jgi:hypothetical protein